MAAHAGKVFERRALPLRMAAVSHCFRQEAGSGRVAEKGLYRLHQFTKVELAALSDDANSEAELQRLVDFQCDLIEVLGLHARVLDMPTEELGASAARKYDVEVWMPGRRAAADAAPGAWGEVSSSSNCTDYQSRRLDIRYRHGNKDNRFVHTLNGTALAVPRIMLALLEAHQTSGGTVRIPEVLQPFMGGITELMPEAR